MQAFEDVPNHGFASAALESAFSPERVSRYLAWARGDQARALALYGLNTALSEAFYTPLQVLEVTMRNRFHTTLSAAVHDHWYDESSFQIAGRQQALLRKAKEDLAHKGKDPTPGQMVATLTFGYWTALLSTHYETLWQTTLHRAVQREDGGGLRRQELAEPINIIRGLRNRIAHHEPIIHWNLPKHHDSIVQLTRWLSPAAADWCAHHSRFALVYPRERLDLAGVA